MAASKETAEEQLLRMIEGPAPGAPKGPWKRFAPKQWLARLRGRGEALWRFALPASSEAGDVLLWRLHLAERMSWVVLTLLGIYLIVDLTAARRQPPTLIVQAAPGTLSSGESAAAARAEDGMKPVAVYREAIMTRNPFTGQVAGTAGPAQDAGAQETLEGMVKTLAVVGINRGRVPEALIEDLTGGRTHFVKVGDRINGMTVKVIEETGVTLTYEGEEIVLR